MRIFYLQWHFPLRSWHADKIILLRSNADNLLFWYCASDKNDSDDLGKNKFIKSHTPNTTGILTRICIFAARMWLNRTADSSIKIEACQRNKHQNTRDFPQLHVVCRILGCDDTLDPRCHCRWNRFVHREAIRVFYRRKKYLE